MRFRRKIFVQAAVFSLLFLPHAARAHTASEGILTVLEKPAAAVAIELQLPLQDLDLAVGLDADDDMLVTWGEVKRKHREIKGYVLSRLEISRGGEACPLAVGEQLVARAKAGTNAVLRLTATCSPQSASEALEISYDLLFGSDARHRGLASVSRQNGEGSEIVKSLVFTRAAKRQVLAVGAR